MVATERGLVSYSVVVVSIGGIQCCALLDTGAGTWYASAASLMNVVPRSTMNTNG